MPSPPLPSLPMSTQTLTKLQHGQKSHRYGMFRVKLKGHQRIHLLRITRRRNSSLNLIIHRARTIAEAVAAKVKRATDRVATATITSTPAGASKVRLDLWVSRVQAKRRLQTRSVFLALPLRVATYGIGNSFGPAWHIAPWRGSFLPSYLLSSDREYGITHMAGGRFLFSL